MATVKEIKATARPRAGKGAARAERRAGRVPGVIYGDRKPPQPISLEYADLRQKIYAGRFLTTVYEIEVDGAKERVIPRDFQLDAVRDNPLHVDFMRLGEGAVIRVNVPVRVLNADQAPGVKRGGTVNIVTHTIPVLVKPENIPEAVDVDISELEINYSKHLSDIKMPEGVRVVSRIDLTLVTIVPPSGYAEEMKAAAAAAAAAVAAAAAAAEAGVVPGSEGAPAAPGAAPGAAPAPGAPAAAGAAAPAAGAAAPPPKK